MLDNLTTINPQFLPADIRKAITARDKAAEAYYNFEAENAHILADDWLDLAEATDLKAAFRAVDAGEDPMELPSEIDRVRSLRPKIKALFGKLEREAKTTNAALSALYRRAAPSLTAEAHTRLDAAMAAAEKSYAAFLADASAANVEMGAIRHLRNQSSGGRTDAPGAGGHPVCADGISANSQDKLTALREAFRTYDAEFVPVKRVRVGNPNGVVIVLDEDRAKAIVGSTNSPGMRILGPADESEAS